MVNREQLAQEIVDAIQMQEEAPFAQVTNVFDRKLDKEKGQFLISSSYTLAEDASVLKIENTVSYVDSNIEYKTPYTFEKSVPKSQQGGALYYNSFTYESERFDTTAMNDDTEDKLLEMIKESYRDENGELPAEGGENFKAYSKDLEAAKDGNMTKSEWSLIKASYWYENDAQALFKAIEENASFLAKYLSADLNSTTVPSMEGVDQVMEETESRMVRMIGSGIQAGSFYSRPKNQSEFATWGNITAYSDEKSESYKEKQREMKDQ